MSTTSVPTTPDLRQFFKEMKEAFPGEVHHDRMHRGIYATDASIYMQRPVGVFTPKNRGAVRRGLRLASSYKVPVLARGGGTSLAGQTTAEGALVLDLSKYFDEIEELSIEERWAVVQPGLIRDLLNERIVQHGIMYAPETATSNRANIGGMIGNNSSGMMSIRYGKTIDHLLGATVFLADGTEAYFGRREEMGDTGERLLDGLLAIIERNRGLIEERFPKVMRRVGGYSLDEFLGDESTHNLAKILAGSEGTLAVMTSAKVNLVEKPKHIACMALHFADLLESLRAMPLVIRHNPLSAEFMDGPLVQMSIANPSTAKMCWWVEGNPAAVIPVEMDGDTLEECIARLDAVEKDLREAGYGYAFTRLHKPEERTQILEVRKAGLGVMLKMKGDWKPISFIEDACVPVEHLADYTAGILRICDEEGLRVMSYGHPSVGVLHLKPVVNLKTQEDRDKCERVSRKAMELCRSFGGSWSGEHGDGIARGANNEAFWGPEMMEVFREVKRLFDPDGLLNPGKIFDTPPVMGPLRYTHGYKTTRHRSQFHYREEGGLQGAVEMCNGVGACRKIGSGTMCPSYMATREEKDSTRGRANALRMALAGQLGPGALTSKGMHDVLDLCLECKACKTECPSNVDMAKMKSEFLHAYHKVHGSTLRDRLFASSPRAARMNAGLLAPLVNGVLGISWVRRTMNRMLGVAVERPLPKYANETLVQWFARRRKPNLPADAAEVVLFDDTYANYHETNIGKWAVRVLEHLGYRVRLARAGCCCRPLISKGFLTKARRDGEQTLRNLDRYARKGIPILGLEPSCVSALRDDVPDLVEDEELGKRVAAHVFPIEEFLEKELVAGRFKLELPEAAESYLLHGHCHQKALNGTGPLKRLLGADGTPRVEEVDSGCCGMAGSFGYEAEHYKISQQIGESRLFPAVRSLKAGTPVIANGFSCRHQIVEATGTPAMHFIEALGRALLGAKERPPKP